MELFFLKKVLRACYNTKAKHRNNKKKSFKTDLPWERWKSIKIFNKYITFENWALCSEKVVQQHPCPHTVHCAICANGKNASKVIVSDSVSRLDKTHKPYQLS